MNTKLSIAVAALPSWAAGLASNTKATRSAWALATTVVAMLATPLSAQDNKQQSEPKHHHYKLIDLGTFGGPQSFVNFPSIGYAPVLNNSGMVAGWADTAVPDPHPNFCFQDCPVEHAFLSKGTGKTNLGSLPASVPTSSQPNWIAESGYAEGRRNVSELQLRHARPRFPFTRTANWWT